MDPPAGAHRRKLRIEGEQPTDSTHIDLIHDLFGRQSIEVLHLERLHFAWPLLVVIFSVRTLGLGFSIRDG